MYRKGALTVEASIVLPVFMLVILSLALSMRIFLAYEKIEFALYKTGMQISEKGYIVKMANLMPSGEPNQYQGKIDNLVENVKEAERNINGAVKNVQSNVKDLQINGLGDIPRFAGAVPKTLESIVDLFGTVVGSFDAIKSGFSALKDKEGFVKWVKEGIINKLSKYALNAFVEMSIKNELNKDINVYIKDDSGKYFNLEESKYFVKEISSNFKVAQNSPALSIKDDQAALVLLDVKFKVKTPMVFVQGFDGVFEGHTRQVFRLWVGGK